MTQLFECEREKLPSRRLCAEKLCDFFGLSTATLADKLNVSQRTVQRWIAEGMTFDQADTVAVALGHHPVEIWPNEWLKGDE